MLRMIKWARGNLSSDKHDSINIPDCFCGFTIAINATHVLKKSDYIMNLRCSEFFDSSFTDNFGKNSRELGRWRESVRLRERKRFRQKE